MGETVAVSGGMRRLSVHAGASRIDAVLSAAMPVGSLIPAIVDALAANSDFDAGPVAVRYQLYAPGGTMLEPSKTLSELGIQDGATVTLICSPTEFAASRNDDAAEAVSDAVTSLTRRWSGQIAHLVGALVGSCLAGVGATVLLGSAFESYGGQRAGCVGVAAATSLVALAMAAAAYRACSEHDAGLALGLAATGFTALAGLVAVPGGPGAPNALFAAAAAGTSAALVRVFACHAIVFTAIACCGATCAIAALVCVLTAQPLPAIGAGLATTSLAIIEAAPTMSLLLARLFPDGPECAPELWDAKTTQAHIGLTSLIIAFSASAAVGAIGVTSRMSTASTAFATVIGGILILRARIHHDVTRAAPQVICGAVTLCAGLLTASHQGRALQVAVLSIVLGFFALCFGFIGGPVTASAAARRSIELIEYCAFATVVPLAFWLCGLFGAVRSVNIW